MELPREILIGDNVISTLGSFVKSINSKIVNVVPGNAAGDVTQ
jgi:hypothetical protein